MKIQAGGPAFPYVLKNTSHEVMNTFGIDLPPGKTADFGGMTLRDYFAAKALQSVPLSLDPNEQALIAKAAYAQADAMLRTREAL